MLDSLLANIAAGHVAGGFFYDVMLGAAVLAILVMVAAIVGLTFRKDNREYKARKYLREIR